jgi:hypothetical protein
MSSSAWFSRRPNAASCERSRPQLFANHRVWKPTIFALALCAGACGSSENPENSAANSGNTEAGGPAEVEVGAAGRAAPSTHVEGGAKAAAGSGTATTTTGAAGSGGTASAGPKQANSGLHGAFTLSLNAAREATPTSPETPARTSFLGLVNDGAKPSPNSWVEEQSAGGCKLYTPVSPLCDPSCGSSAACVSDNMCVPYPKSQSVGAITLKGVGDAPVEMTPIGSSNNYQPKAGTMLPYPPCAESAELTLSVEGGMYEGFELQTKCIAPLDFQGPIKLEKATPLKLAWQAPGDPALARIQIRLNISHHGGSRGEIRCDVEDNGALELPATMVDRLLELGVAGFPTIILTRVSTGGAVGGSPEHVEFIVQQYVERAVEIDGLVSCNDTQLCPEGQTCQSDLSCK